MDKYVALKHVYDMGRVSCILKDIKGECENNSKDAYYNQLSELEKLADNCKDFWQSVYDMKCEIEIDNETNANSELNDAKDIKLLKQDIKEKAIVNDSATENFNEKAMTVDVEHFKVEELSQIEDESTVVVTNVPQKKKPVHLSKTQRINIVRQFANGVNQRTLAKRYNVSRTTVQKIIRDAREKELVKFANTL